MVKLKFIVRGNNLLLRISENKERFYKSTKHLLKGNPNIARHWNSDKERFSNYAVSYAENNRALEEFKEIYSSLIKSQPDLSAKQAAQYYSSAKQMVVLKTQEEITAGKGNELNLVEKFLETVIEREKEKI